MHGLVSLHQVGDFHLIVLASNLELRPPTLRASFQERIGIALLICEQGITTTAIQLQSYKSELTY